MVMNAHPELRSESRLTHAVSIPFASRPCIKKSPMMSFPTAPTKVAFAPNRTTATAWLAPLPPGKNLRLVASKLSPSLGRRSAWTTKSKLVLPTITIFLAPRTAASPRSPWGRKFQIEADQFAPFSDDVKTVLALSEYSHYRPFARYARELLQGSPLHAASVRVF